MNLMASRQRLKPKKTQKEGVKSRKDEALLAFLLSPSMLILEMGGSS